MGRIAGYYEWDNDDLTPGRKKEGGLHQTLFDSEGKLRGNARFVPSEGSGGEPFVVTETVYVPVEERRRSREEEELLEAIAEVVSRLIDHGIAKAKPIAERWWRETARPALDAHRARIRKRPSRLRGLNAKPATEVAIVEPSPECTEVRREDRPEMSSAEARARYLAALAARVFSDEQMRLVSRASIVDGASIADIERSLAELPRDQVKALIEAMATDPSMLGEDALADLASVLERRDRRQSACLRQFR